MSSSLKRLIDQQQSGIETPAFGGVTFNPNNALAPPKPSILGGQTGGPGLPQHLLPPAQQVDPGNVQSMPATLTSQLTGPAIQTEQDQRPPGLIERLVDPSKRRRLGRLFN